MIRFEREKNRIIASVIAQMPDGLGWEWRPQVECHDEPHAMLLIREFQKVLDGMEKLAYEEGHRDGRARRKKSEFWTRRKR